MIASLREVVCEYAGSDFRLSMDEFDVAPRERVALVGPSGSGKSTLLGAMAGLVRVRAARLTVAGVDLRQAPQAEVRAMRASRIGMVHQDFQLLDELDVERNILLPNLVSSALRLDDAARARAAELATRAGLGRMLRRSVTRLSQGERQRVAVCRAVVAAPQLVLADEPTASLDAGTRDRTIELLLDECERAGAALVAATHDLELAARMGRTVRRGGAA